MSWRNTREYRKWRISVIRRDKKCVICNSNEKRVAHHINNGSHHPEERFLVSNGITLCRKCHTAYHTMFKSSFRKKTNIKDWENFLDLVDYLNKIKKDI